ncbi:hypothetical protein GCM10008106_12620 [Mongoliitalea lutea]|uniref:Uncharacterized protein n=1 Tax=Mongoliitalea lutea TaxID=849756 RepID=A0A8J3G545_9BACT|nr:hypothetical protein GCM10008106_12620 [Mongoliitalea lutea]
MFIVCVLFLSSCLPENFEEPNLNNSEVLKAKQWFESQDLKNLPGTESKNARVTNPETPYRCGFQIKNGYAQKCRK